MTDVLNQNVLILNKNYSPVWITSAKKAFIMLFKKIAEVVQVKEDVYNNYDFISWAEVSEYKKMFKEIEGTEDWVHTSSLTLEVPRIIRLLNYSRLPNTKTKLCRRNIFHRDGNHCQYCGKKFNTKELNIDHIIPKSKGGRATWGNLVCTCYSCNSRKGNRRPIEAGMKLIRKPFEPKFLPLSRIHFGSKKYASWEKFLDFKYWSVEIED